MKEKQDIVDVIEKDIKSLMGLAKQRKFDSTTTIDEKQKEIQTRLLNYQRGDLVSLGFLSYAISQDPGISELAMRGLLQLDASLHSKSVINKVIDVALFVAEGKDIRSAAVAIDLLQRYVNEGEYAHHQIDKHFQKICAIELVGLAEKSKFK